MSVEIGALNLPEESAQWLHFETPTVGVWTQDRFDEEFWQLAQTLERPVGVASATETSGPSVEDAKDAFDAVVEDLDRAVGPESREKLKLEPKGKVISRDDIFRWWWSG